MTQFIPQNSGSDKMLTVNEIKILELEIMQAETDIMRFRRLERDSLISRKEM